MGGLPNKSMQKIHTENKNTCILLYPGGGGGGAVSTLAVRLKNQSQFLGDRVRTHSQSQLPLLYVGSGMMGEECGRNARGSRCSRLPSAPRGSIFSASFSTGTWLSLHHNPINLCLMVSTNCFSCLGGFLCQPWGTLMEG